MVADPPGDHPGCAVEAAVRFDGDGVALIRCRHMSVQISPEMVWVIAKCFQTGPNTVDFVPKCPTSSHLVQFLQPIANRDDIPYNFPDGM